MLEKLKFDTNPIIVKELRSRMRGGRLFATLTGALVLMVIISYGLYQATLAGSQYSSTPISPQVGQMLFIGLAFLELFIIAAVTPAITASEISSEKEKQTYEMLLTTPLDPTSILWGKLVASLSYIFILIFAAIPMASVIFIFGGVTSREMIQSLLYPDRDRDFLCRNWNFLLDLGQSHNGCDHPDLLGDLHSAFRPHFCRDFD